MIRQQFRRRPTCGAFTRFPDEETGHVSVYFCTLPLDHALDQHFDRRRGHWWPRVDAPTLPPPVEPTTRPDDLLF